MTSALRMAPVVLLAAANAGCFWLVAGGAGAEAGYVAGQDDRSAGETVSDQWIHAKVKAELVASSAPSRRLDVGVRKGVVTLKGVLDNAEQKQTALNAAKAVKGVRKVVDKIYLAN